MSVPIFKPFSVYYHFRLTALVLVILSTAVPAAAIDLRQVEKELATTGAQGWIHGSLKDRQLFVFTYRNPENFFDYAELPLVGDDSMVVAKLASFKRHDKVLIKGTFLHNSSPQTHVLVTSVEMVKKYESAYPSDSFSYDSEVPRELLKQREGTFLVHAIAGDGHVLVLEYQGMVVPLVARNNERTRDLSRNDLVHVKYIVRRHPSRPVHLEIDEDAASPVKLMESIKNINGKPASLEGALVLFPKSPQIITNVFAVLQETRGGTNRQFTIVNFENAEVLKQAREKLQQAWDRHPGEYINGRNKLISKTLRVHVTGIFNQVDANQANPQILISSAEDVRIIGE